MFEPKLSSTEAQNKYVQNEKIRSDIRFDIYEESIRASKEEERIRAALEAGEINQAEADEARKLNKPINEQYLEGLTEVYDSVPYTFAELPYDAMYIKSLKEKYTFETGKEFTSTDPEEIQHLVDEDFSDMNFIMNNVSIGMGSELLKNLALRSDEEKANFLQRWNTFHRTPNTDSYGVDDSRPFLEIKFPGKIDPSSEEGMQRLDDLKELPFGAFEVTGQLGDFIKGAGPDPLAWLMFASGAGFVTNKMIQKGVVSWLAPKVGKKAAEVIPRVTGLSTAGAAFSGIHDTGKQMVEMTGGKKFYDPSVRNEKGEIIGGYVDQKYDPVQTLQSMGYGFVLTPALTYGVGTVMGPVSRVITSPKQSFEKIIGFAAGTKSQMAAAQGVMVNLENKLKPLNEGKGVSKVVTDLRDFLGAGYNAVDNYFNIAFDSIKSAPIRRQSIDGLVDRWNTVMGGGTAPQQLSKTWNLLYEKYLQGENAKGNPNLNVKEIPLIDLARQLRKEFYSANVKDKKDNAGINRETISGFKDTINNVLNKAIKKVDPKKAAKLDKSYSLFKKQTTDNKYGKDLLAMSVDTSTESITAFLNKMLKPDFSWAEFSGAIKHFEKLDYIVGSKGNNQLATGLRTKIERAMGTKIMEAKDGAKLLTELTRTVDGRKTLKNIFPSLTKQLDDIIYMQENLGAWGGAESVIGNMTMANIGAMTGKSILGEQGRIMGPLLSIVGWNKLMNSTYFKNAMVHAYKNNNGTLDSATRRYIVKNFTKEDGSAMTMANVNAIQDTMWAYTYAGYALHGEDVLDERTKDKVWDAYSDLKVQFDNTINPLKEMRIQ
tara:strand:- start:22 stop:2496 length:2475 start_codon:yes stop_codon:yes gene_type:complete